MAGKRIDRLVTIEKNVPEPKNSRIIFCYIEIVNKISGSFSTVNNCELAVF